jgi:uncharacterized protein with GYD domain
MAWTVTSRAALVESTASGKNRRQFARDEEVGPVASYLFRFTYTPESWAALIEHPEDRREMLSTRVFAFGGQLQGFWYSFGEHHGYALVELPDNVSAAAVLAAISSTGALRDLEAIVLIPAEDMVEALGRAHEFGYKQPGTLST